MMIEIYNNYIIIYLFAGHKGEILLSYPESISARSRLLKGLDYKILSTRIICRYKSIHLLNSKSIHLLNILAYPPTLIYYKAACLVDSIIY